MLPCRNSSGPVSSTLKKKKTVLHCSGERDVWYTWKPRVIVWLDQCAKIFIDGQSGTANSVIYAFQRHMHKT